MNTRMRRAAGVLLALVLTVFSAARAEDFTWTGAVDQDLTNYQNWTNGRVDGGRNIPFATVTSGGLGQQIVQAGTNAYRSNLEMSAGTATAPSFSIWNSDFTLKNGTLQITNPTAANTVFYMGTWTPTFKQEGGTLNVDASAGIIRLDEGSSFTFKQGTMTAKTMNWNGSASFTQEGGTLNVNTGTSSQGISLGNTQGQGGTAKYILKAGDLNTTSFRVGNYTKGEVVQYSGNVVALGNLSIGHQDSASAAGSSWTIYGGTVKVSGYDDWSNIDASLMIGRSVAGSMNIHGGTVQAQHLTLSAGSSLNFYVKGGKSGMLEITQLDATMLSPLSATLNGTVSVNFSETSGAWELGSRSGILLSAPTGTATPAITQFGNTQWLGAEWNTTGDATQLVYTLLDAGKKGALDPTTTTLEFTAAPSGWVDVALDAPYDLAFTVSGVNDLTDFVAWLGTESGAEAGETASTVVFRGLEESLFAWDFTDYSATAMATAIQLPGGGTEAVPEPGAWCLLLACGALGALGFLRKQGYLRRLATQWEMGGGI